MKNLIASILSAIFVLVAVLIIIFFISVVKNCSGKEAAKILKKFMAETFGELFKPNPPPEPVYPVLVGYDGYRIVPELVNEEFSIIRNNFLFFYNNAAIIASDGHSVKYRFAIERKPDCPDDEILQSLIQKQAEEILTRTLLAYDCYMSAEALTAVELKPNCLYVAFARTQTGIQQLDDLKQRIRRRQIASKRQIASRRQGQSKKFREKWENGE